MNELFFDVECVDEFFEVLYKHGLMDEYVDIVRDAMNGECNANAQNEFVNKLYGVALDDPKVADVLKRICDSIRPEVIDDESTRNKAAAIKMMGTLGIETFVDELESRRKREYYEVDFDDGNFTVTM